MERVRSSESEPTRIGQEAEDYLRNFEDTKTWLAEVLNGNMRTSFDFYWDGSDIYSRDGRYLGEIFDKSIDDARLKAKFNSTYEFETRRRLVEYGEYEDMVAMARDEELNTMVVVSDFPEELMDATEDIGGYNVKRKQTMLRVISKNTGGVINVTSQSLDGSNRQALEEIYKTLGEEPREGELLGQRVHMEIRDEELQSNIINILTKAYDTSMEQQYEVPHYAGRKNGDWHNTYNFVETQRNLVDACVLAQYESPPEADKFLKQTAALMSDILERGHPEIINVGFKTILGYMQNAGIRANNDGRTYSGCGLSLATDNSVESTEGQLEKLGYGTKTETMKCVTCPFCKKTVDAIVTKEKICCPKCNASAKR